MHVMFEVYLAPGSRGDALITPQTMQETQAQIMTKEEAEAVGFAGIPDDPEGRARRFIICAQSDARRIQQQLDASPDASAYDVHEINL